MWKNNLLFKILVSCTDNGKKKPQVSKKKVSFPSLKTDQGCSCKQPSYNKLAETSYHQKHLTIKFYIDLDAINKNSLVLDGSLLFIHIL